MGQHHLSIVQSGETDQRERCAQCAVGVAARVIRYGTTVGAHCGNGLSRVDAAPSAQRKDEIAVFRPCERCCRFNLTIGNELSDFFISNTVNILFSQSRLNEIKKAERVNGLALGDDESPLTGKTKAGEFFEKAVAEMEATWKVECKISSAHCFAIVDLP